MNGRAGKLQEKLYYTETILTHRKHQRANSLRDLRHEVTATRRTQENLKVAQIAKEVTLTNLMKSSGLDRDSCLEAYKEADTNEKDAYIQQMVADMKRKAEEEKEAAIKRVSEEKDSQISDLLNRLAKQTLVNKERQILLNAIDLELVAS